jgi:hypothetical protein
MGPNEMKSEFSSQNSLRKRTIKIDRFPDEERPFTMIADLEQELSSDLSTNQNSKDAYKYEERGGGNISELLDHHSERQVGKKSIAPDILHPGDIKMQLKAVRRCFNAAIDGLLEVQKSLVVHGV